ncbi:MAG: H4MPT-linked C1 transfer pathway protein [Methanoregulaceae archaeon]|nr:H4MPT-linked C1 transfer pathway protein [Methanoregulaceae archaeon]
MIGIDVGGAHLKVASRDGVYIHPCPLWQGAPLKELLRCHRQVPGEKAVVVMSGELADCFSGKDEGIAFIVDAVREVFPEALFYGIDGRFHDRAVRELAAANWLASADYLRQTYPGAVLVDIGSTTTDIIPLGNFSALSGLTDIQRLQRGFLVYTGMLRTSIPTLLRAVDLRGIRTPVSTEFFACSGDAHRVLGHITEEQYAGDTPDHQGKDRAACLRRLARVVCADVQEIGEEGAIRVAEEFVTIQEDMVSRAVSRAVTGSGAKCIVTAGIGAGIFAAILGGTDLSVSLGAAADALPAFAVLEVARREHIS